MKKGRNFIQGDRGRKRYVCEYDEKQRTKREGKIDRKEGVVHSIIFLFPLMTATNLHALSFLFYSTYR